MRNTAARALLRQGLARPELGRVSVLPIDTISTKVSRLLNTYPSSQDAVRPRFIAGASKHIQYPQPQPYSVLSPPRAFHTSTARHRGGWSAERKKHKKEAKEPKGAKAAKPADGDHDSEGPRHPPANKQEPLDFADVESRVQRQGEHFREALKKLRTGGRFNPDIVGALRVQPDRKSSTTYPLKEVAQIVPRGGRTISILVHEEAYVKPIMSAVQSSADFNQQPQRDPDNELELILKIEPESRDDLLKRIKAMCHEWRERVRSVRQKRDKLHTMWRKDGGFGPDLKRTADKELEKVIKARLAEIDEAEKEALKAVEAK